MNKRDDASARTQGFTLIELLIVIAIIAILATLATASVGKLLDNARRTQAKTVMHSLELAIKAYQTEYSRLPAPVRPQPQEDNEDGYDTSTQEGKDLLDILMARNDAANPKAIRHYSPPASSGDAGYTDAHGLIDVWGQNGYRIVFDYDNDGQIADPYDAASGGAVHVSVIIYSAGRDKQFDTGNASKKSDDVKSW
jgi:prepilin-type N-terminal cleavage/methylation domain-containing protein